MLVYQIDDDGYYIGDVQAEESPLEPSTFLMPGGTVSASPPKLKTGERAQWVTGAWVVVPPPVEPDPDPEPAPTSENVNWERQTRIDAGVTVTLTGGLDIPLQGRALDQMALVGLVTAANMRIAAGDPTHVTKFRDALNVDHDLTPPQIVEMWSLGSAWVQSIIEASWEIKDLGTIPTDYADDSRWP